MFGVIDLEIGQGVIKLPEPSIKDLETILDVDLIKDVTLTLHLVHAKEGLEFQLHSLRLVEDLPIHPRVIIHTTREEASQLNQGDQMHQVLLVTQIALQYLNKKVQYLPQLPCTLLLLTIEVKVLKKVQSEHDLKVVTANQLERLDQVLIHQPHEVVLKELLLSFKA